MATPVAAIAAVMVATRLAADLARFEVFWRDEVAAAGLYRDLAGLVDGECRGLLRDLAATEERHVAHWAALLEGEGRELVEPSRPWRHRVLLPRRSW